MQFDIPIASETLAVLKPNADDPAKAPQIVAHLDLRILPDARCLFFGRAGTKDVNLFKKIIETDSGVVVALRGEDTNAIDARLKEIGVDPAKSRFSLLI